MDGEDLPAVIAFIGTSSILGTILAKVTLSITPTALGIRAGHTGILTLSGPVSLFTAVSASSKVLAWLGAITDAMIESLAVGALEDNTIFHVIFRHFKLATSTEMTLLC
jgi:hypothetical protein